MHTSTFHNGEHSFTYVDHPMYLPAKTAAAMCTILSQWQSVFNREATYAQTQFGVPSLLVRYDGVLAPDGSFLSYEIQDGSGWAGYAGLANESFKTARDYFVKNIWPPFRLLQDLETPRDYGLWVENIGIDEALATNELLLFRYWSKADTLSREQLWNFTMRSISPCWTHNDKSYGVPLGWWKYVRFDTSNNGEKLPWDTAFVIKPLQEWGSKDIMYWIPNERRGRSTRTQILGILEKHRVMYLQPFIAPMTTVLDVPYNTILRPFFAYDIYKKTWVPLGGVWTGRPAPNLRIHGASDAVSGPLLLEH